MRIVGGALSGRRFAGPKGDRTRPTSDRVREAIASMVESRGGFSGTHVLDLYAGTGAMAFEAISRGARSAVLVEADRNVAQAIRASAKELGIELQCTVLQLDAEKSHWADAMKQPFDRVFVDPPYVQIAQVTAILRSLDQRSLLAPDCLLVIEHAKKSEVALPPGWVTTLLRTYGDTSVLLSERSSEESL